MILSLVLSLSIIGLIILFKMLSNSERHFTLFAAQKNKRRADLSGKSHLFYSKWHTMSEREYQFLLNPKCSRNKKSVTLQKMYR